MPTSLRRRPVEPGGGSALRRVIRLRPARRGVVVARAVAWVALATGPAALIVSQLTPGTVAPSAQPAAAAAPAVRSVDPSGVAELFCDLWLRSDARMPDSDTAQSVRALAPSVDLPRSGAQGDAQRVVRTVSVRSAELEEGRWSVVVAAHFERAAGRGGAQTSVRYFAVPVAVSSASGGAGAFRVTGVPAQVAGPRSVDVAEAEFPHVLPARGALAVTLGEFFNAFLADVGRVDRYLAPGTELAGVGGSTYESVRLDEVAAAADVADGAVPADGMRVRVQARVTAHGPDQARMPLRYTVVVAARSGRWEVSSLEAGAQAAPVRTGPSAQGGAQ